METFEDTHGGALKPLHSCVYPPLAAALFGFAMCRSPPRVQTAGRELSLSKGVIILGTLTLGLLGKDQGLEKAVLS